MCVFLIIEPKMPCLIGGGSCDFQPSFRGGSLHFSPIGRGGSEFSNHHILKCSAPPSPLYFLTSPLVKRLIWSECWKHKKQLCHLWSVMRVTLIFFFTDQTQAPARPNVELCNLWNLHIVLKTQSFVACTVEINLAWNLTEMERLTL